jgi:hypothetical protein
VANGGRACTERSDISDAMLHLGSVPTLWNVINPTSAWHLEDG